MIQQSQPQTSRNVAENHNDLLQAASLITGIRRSRRDHFFNCAGAETFSQAFETAPCQIKLAKTIKVLDVRHLGTFVSAGSPLASILGLSSFSFKLNLKAPVTVWRLGDLRTSL